MRLVDLVGLVAFLLLRRLLRALPPGISYECAKVLGQVSKHVIPKRRAIVQKNYSIFRETQNKLCVLDAVAFEDTVFRNLGVMAWTLARLDGIYPNLIRMTDFKIPSEFWGDLESHGSVIFATAHMGSFELLPSLMHRIGQPIAVVYQPLTNSLVNQLVKNIRSKSTILIENQNSFKELMACCKANISVGLVSDQQAEIGSAQVSFMGIPTTTHSGFAKLHIRSGKPIWFAVMLRTSGMNSNKPFQLFLRQMNVFPHITDPNERAHLIVKEYYAVLEDLIIQYPEQYYWVHDRWK